MRPFPQLPLVPTAVGILLLAGCTGIVKDPPGGPGGGPNGEDPDEIAPARPGLEFQCDEGEGIDPGPNMVRRLTLPEYVATVRATVGVDLEGDAATMLPKDLRADGFGNTAAALVVTLEHVQAYEDLARVAVERIDDLDALIGGWVSCREMTAACERELIDGIGLRLYRAPVAADERESLRELFRVVEDEGEGFLVAAGLVLEAMLQSPRFLYRVENERGDGSIRDLDGFEVASRLSYLLWNGPPDEELLSAAQADALATDGELEAQIARMLDDPRARQASLLYLGDWLGMGRLSSLPRDAELYPDWDPALGQDMEAETRAFFEHVVWEQERPMLDLFGAQVTFVTPELASYYGLPADGEVRGDGLIEVDTSGIPQRGGLLTQGSALTVGGDGASMVSRGLFLLESILCGHLGDPPPGVDTTPPDPMPGASQRVYSEARVADPLCGGCHVQMEPLVWGLERFDGTGVYRLEDHYGNELREDGRVLVPGDETETPYETVEELMDILATNDRVRDCMTLKATQFALGRPILETDGCSLSETRERLRSTDATFQDLLVSIGLSPGFRTLRTEAE